jgi:hypothetical protein
MDPVIESVSNRSIFSFELGLISPKESAVVLRSAVVLHLMFVEIEFVLVLDEENSANFSKLVVF